MTEENEQNEEQNDLLKNDGKDLQRLQSWLGRVEKSQKELADSLTEKLSAIGEKLESNQGPQRPQFGDDEQEKFNEKLHEMILNGKVMEAVKLIQDVDEKAKTMMKQADQKKFDRAMSALAEDPIMKNEDLAKKISESAQALVSQGYTPELAVSTAKANVENEALRSMVQSGGDVSLDMLGGGSQNPPATKEKKLPPGAERAYQSGKEKGLFNSRDEYLDALDPRVRQEWGL